MEYRVISTDDHLQEAPDAWTSRMSRKWGDDIPHLRRDDDGTDNWYIHGHLRQPNGIGTVNGAMPDRTVHPKTWDEVPVCTYVPSERIKAMEADGVDVHTFFSNISGVAGNTFSNPEFEEEYRIEAIRAYNDYQVEEWSTPYPGRFITLTQVPMWDVGLAVEEAYRGKRMGMNGLTFAFPQQFGYPHIADPYWDPLWAAAQETGLSVNLHIGSGGSMGITDTGRWEGQHRLFGSAEGSVKTISANIQVMSTILFSNILERFPGVKFVSSESGIGWVPYLLEVSDHQHQQQALARLGMPLKPSEYFHRQCYVNFWFEENGPAQRDIIGVENIMWESDFPHPTCTYPNSQMYIERATAGWSEEDRHKVLVGNARNLYHLGE